MKQHSPLSSPVLVICILALITDCRSEVVRHPQQQSVVEGSSVGGSYEDWLRWRDALKQEKSLIRHYTFDDLGETSMTSADLAGKGGAMSFGVVPKRGVPQDKLVVQQGRWKQCKSVRLDQGFLAAKPFEVEDRSFTIEAWVRTHGIGTHRGNSGATNGTLLSIGIGYWDGWRLTVTYPAKTIGLEIGRPKPSHSVGIRTRQAISDRVWTHLAASWDGQEMRIYINGMLAARGDYSGDYTPPTPAGRFKIGYAGYGWGSVNMDADEVIVFDRALSAEQLFRHAHFHAPVADSFLEHLQLAESALKEGETAKAAKALKAALAHADLHADLQAAVRLKISDLETRNGNPSGAAKLLVPALQLPGLSERYSVALLDRLLHLAVNGAGDAIPTEVHERFLRMTAGSPRERLRVRLNIARSFRAAEQFNVARQHLQAIADSPDTPMADRMNLRLELGHTCLEGNAPQAARLEYEKVASSADAPGYYRAYAQWLVAESLAAAKSDAEARIALERLAGMADAPEHFRSKARRKLGREPSPGTKPAGPARLKTLKQPKLKLYIAP
ncbi:MAG: LamG domain-containing protein, partial [Planctomycetota bacterium]|nr:LamG domain-containing protein [Planctomycetota bacterium]